MKSIGTILKESWGVLKANLRNILIITVLFQIAYGVLYLFGGVAGYVLIALPIVFGLTIAFLQLVRNNQPIEVAQVVAPVKSENYWKILITYGWSTLFTFLWSLLWVIPGVYKALTYSLAPYIVAENPEIYGKEALKKSAEMMKGHIGQLLVIWLIFCAAIYVAMWFWFIPVILVIIPFYFIVMAKFYDEVKGAYEAAK
jgi:uncharacterized membrane protein